MFWRYVLIFVHPPLLHVLEPCANVWPSLTTTNYSTHSSTQSTGITQVMRQTLHKDVWLVGVFLLWSMWPESSFEGLPMWFSFHCVCLKMATRLGKMQELWDILTRQNNRILYWGCGRGCCNEIYPGLLTVGRYPVLCCQSPMNALCWPGSRYI